MLNMWPVKQLCSMVLKCFQDLVFVVLEVCAEAHQKTKTSEGNSTRILNINVIVDHDPTWTYTSKFDEVAFLRDSLFFCCLLRGSAFFADSARSC